MTEIVGFKCILSNVCASINLFTGLGLSNHGFSFVELDYLECLHVSIRVNGLFTLPRSHIEVLP